MTSTAPKDPYDFTQPSPLGEPGFEVFFSEAHEAWFFHANDVNCQPLLFSQAYQNADSAKRGLSAALKNAATRAAIEPVGEHWQIVLKAGNHQEMARSRLLPTEGEAQKALAYVQQVAKSKKPMAEVPAAQQPATPAEQDDSAHLRHSFRLFFYKGSDGDCTGRIEDMQTRRQLSFQGIDLPSIGSFLGQAMPDVAAASSPASPAAAAASTTTGALRHSEGEGTAQGGGFRLAMVGEPLSLSLSLPDGPAHHVLGGKLLLLDRRAGNSHPLYVANMTADAAQARIDFESHVPNGLAQGVYELSVEVQLFEGPGIRTCQGATLLQVV